MCGVKVLNTFITNFIKGGLTMANKYTEAQKRATLKYQEDKVKIQILITPDQREKYKALASSKGLNLTQLIVKLLEDAI